MIHIRYPLYREKIESTEYFSELQSKQLIGLNVMTQEGIVPIRRKQKFLVQHQSEGLHIREVENTYLYGYDAPKPSPPYVNLYSVQRVDFREDVAYITFTYQNEFSFEVTEQDILKLRPVRKKAKREDTDIQNLLQELNY